MVPKPAEKVPRTRAWEMLVALRNGGPYTEPFERLLDILIDREERAMIISVDRARMVTVMGREEA